MELSPGEMPNLEYNKNICGFIKEEDFSSSPIVNDLIDVSIINFDDDENWLLESPHRSEDDFHEWLHTNDTKPKVDNKILDSRTFTRPKKRNLRPSIEKYNEQLFAESNASPPKVLSDSGIHVNGSSQENSPGKPLHFDLNQQSSSLYFDKMLASAGTIDSFQNMSPPSLVNSMCSSTFTNLMENSYIKNDPLLREIRDTDYTQSILQLEEDPMYQSMTGSFSSVNSDNPENFLKKVSFNGTFSKGEDMEKTLTKDGDGTFCVVSEEQAQKANGTYQRKPRKSTFTVADMKNATLVVNRRKIEDLNSTKPINRSSEIPIEGNRRLLDRRASPSRDLNRLNYTADSTIMKNSQSSDSADLDYLSASSGSSRSARTISVEEINIIVERQERSLNIMSTPIHKNTSSLKWDKISPISGRNSDPELSSSEVDIQTVMSNTIRKQKSLCNISKQTSPRSVHTIQKPLLSYAKARAPEVKTSKTNLNSIGQRLKGSYTSLKPINPNLPVAPPLNITRTLENKTANVTHTVIHEKPDQFVKPAPVRASALPRPASASTGIPRPATRIPGPRTFGSIPKPAGAQGKYH